VAWGLHDSIEIEKQGRPAVTVLTTAFETAAAAQAGVLDLPDHRTVLVQHPIASLMPSEVEKMAEDGRGRRGARGRRPHAPRTRVMASTLP
jgi:hypothetical protein